MQQLQRQVASHCAERPAVAAPPRRRVGRRRQASSIACSASHSNPAVFSATLLERQAQTPATSSGRLTSRPVEPVMPRVYEYLGLAQAIVDFTAPLPSDKCLARVPFTIEKGKRRVISLDERHAILEELEDLGCESQVSPGGSLANTLVAMSRLSQAHGNHNRLALAGCVGSDTLGSYFNAQLGQAGVDVLVDQDNLCHTGTVMVLTTPDAQRSFLSFFDSGSVKLTAEMARAVARSKIVIIEGYMLEMPGATTWVHEVAKLAHRNGSQVVLTAGDPTVVTRHRQLLQSLLSDGLVDVLFCNREEACEMLGCELDSAACSTPALAEALASHTSLAVVTDGSRGACIATRGEVHLIPPHWAPKGPVDVCGAGDAFAAGVLYAHSCGYSPQVAGAFAARVAAAVISRHGAQLESEDAQELVQWLPDHVSIDWLQPGTTPAASSA